MPLYFPLVLGKKFLFASVSSFPNQETTVVIALWALRVTHTLHNGPRVPCLCLRHLGRDLCTRNLLETPCRGLSSLSTHPMGPAQLSFLVRHLQCGSTFHRLSVFHSSIQRNYRKEILYMRMQTQLLNDPPFVVLDFCRSVPFSPRVD